MSNIGKTTIIVTVFNILGIGLSFLSNIFIAKFFGTSIEMDVYLSASAFPLFLTSIITGALSVTFIPIFSECKDNKEIDVWEIVSTLLNISFVFTLIITIIIFFFAKEIINVVSPGFDVEKMNLGISILRWQSPLIILTVINELITSVYYSNSLFKTPLINRLISPLLTILIIVLMSNSVSIYSVVYASIAGSIVQTLILVGGFLRNKNFKYYCKINFKNNKVVETGKLMIPLVGGMIFYRVMPVFDKVIGSKLEQGSISYLGYSYKIFSQIPPLISTGISVSIFPMLSVLVINGSIDLIKDKISKAIRMILFICLPITIIIFINSNLFIKILYERGVFTSKDTLFTGQALSLYILTLPILAIGDIISKGYYAFKDTKTPAIVGVFEVIIYIITVYLLLPYFGYLSIPISYIIYIYVSMINIYFLRKKLGNTGGKKIIYSFLQYLLISIITSLFIYYINNYIEIIFIKLLLIILNIFLYFILNLLLFKNEESIIFLKLIKKITHIK